MEKMSIEKVSEFIKLLVELGGIYQVDEEYYITDVDGDRQCLKEKPIKIFNPNMRVSDNAIYLNPFKDTVTETSERAWFWNTRSVMLSWLVGQLVREVCRLVVEGNEELPVTTVGIVSQFAGDIDAKTLGNIESYIKPTGWLNLYYNKRQHTAQLQSNIFDEEFRASCKKMRKKDWKAVDNMLTAFLGTIELNLYKFKAEHVGTLETESRLQVIYMACDAMDEYAKALLDEDLHVAELQCGISKLQDYHQASRWFSSAASIAEANETATKATEDVPPWRKEGGIPITQSTPQPAAQMQPTGVPGRGVMVSQLPPSGSIPIYQQPQPGPYPYQQYGQPPMGYPQPQQYPQYPQQQYPQYPQQGGIPMPTNLGPGSAVATSAAQNQPWVPR